MIIEDKLYRELLLESDIELKYSLDYVFKDLTADNCRYLKRYKVSPEDQERVKKIVKRIKSLFKKFDFNHLKIINNDFNYLLDLFKKYNISKKFFSETKLAIR